MMYETLADAYKKNKKLIEFLRSKNILTEFKTVLNWKTLHAGRDFELNFVNIQKEVLRFKTIKEWILSSRRTYDWASRNRKVNQLTKHMIKKKYTNTELILLAKKYKNISSFRKKHDSQYRTIIIRGLKTSAFCHMDIKYQRGNL